MVAEKLALRAVGDLHAALRQANAAITDQTMRNSVRLSGQMVDTAEPIWQTR